MSDDFFQHLAVLHERGRPVVPLLGAGVSVDSGVPIVSGLRSYLESVVLDSLVKGHSVEHLRSQILENGWPNRCQAHMDALLTLACGGQDRRIGKDNPLAAVDRETRTWMREWICEAAIAHELRRCSPSLAVGHARLADQVAARRPGLLASTREVTPAGQRAGEPSTDWRALLQLVAGDDPGLLDAFFDTLVRNRPPGASHQFLAFLTLLFGWRLVLTTNFDDLLETALREHRLQPSVYEIIHGAPLPDPALVNRHLAVLKLHGGAYSLRAGFDLDEPMDPRDIQTLTRYVPRNAAILVLGYGGRDRRVMSFLEHWMDDHNERELAWIHWPAEGPPPSVLRLRDRHPRRVRTLPYHDARLILQEIYLRIARTHPVSPTWYRALNSPVYRLVETAADAEQRQGEIELRACGVGPTPTYSLIESEKNEVASGLLWKRVTSSSDAIPIRIDCSSLHTFASFVDTLWSQICAHDDGLPLALASQLPPKTDPKVRTKRLAKWVRLALQRNTYILAVDRPLDWGEPHPADPIGYSCPDSPSTHPYDHATSATANQANEQFAITCELLEQLADPPEIGESVVVIATRRPGSADLRNARARQAWENLTRRFSSFSTAGSPGLPLLGESDTSHAAINFTSLSGEEQTISLVCAAARQPMSLVGLEAVAAELGFAGDRRCLPQARDLESTVLRLVERGVLQRLEGAAFDMEGCIRRKFYANLGLPDDPRATNPIRRSALHHALANYYIDRLFRQSGDPHAFFEYAFHRLLSAVSAETENAREAVLRLKFLDRTLGDATTLLLSRSPGGPFFEMVDWIRGVCQSILGTSRSQNTEFRGSLIQLELRATMVKATALRETGEYALAEAEYQHASALLKPLLETAPKMQATESKRRLRDDARTHALIVSCRATADRAFGNGLLESLDGKRRELEALRNSLAGRSDERLRIKLFFNELRLVTDAMQITTSGKTREELFCTAVALHEAAIHQVWLFDDTRKARFGCYLGSYRSRAELLRENPDYTAAYTWLNQAHALVAGPGGHADWTARAVVDLHLANTSLRQVRRDVQNWVQSPNESAALLHHGALVERSRVVQGWVQSPNESAALLHHGALVERSRVALDSAANLLKAGGRISRWRAWRHLLQASANVMDLLVLQSSTQRQGTGTDGEFVSPLRIDTLCLAALTSMRNAWANLPSGTIGQQMVKELWWCALVAWAGAHPDSALKPEHWTMLNQRAGFDQVSEYPYDDYFPPRDLPAVQGNGAVTHRKVVQAGSESGGGKWSWDPFLRWTRQRDSNGGVGWLCRSDHPGVFSSLGFL